jgi:hypothetical protein
LARAALANVHPALLAGLSEGREVEQFAPFLGFTPTDGKFSPKSIPTNEVIRRLGEILPNFDKEDVSFCQVHIGCGMPSYIRAKRRLMAFHLQAGNLLSLKRQRHWLASMKLELAASLGRKKQRLRIN